MKVSHRLRCQPTYLIFFTLPITLSIRYLLNKKRLLSSHLVGRWYTIVALSTCCSFYSEDAIVNWIIERSVVCSSASWDLCYFMLQFCILKSCYLNSSRVKMVFQKSRKKSNLKIELWNHQNQGKFSRNMLKKTLKSKNPLFVIWLRKEISWNTFHLHHLSTFYGQYCR